MANEHLPPKGDARFFMTHAQVKQLGETITAFAERFAPPKAGQPAPEPPLVRPRLTLVTTGPLEDAWHRTTYFEDGGSQVRISAWEHMVPSYCHEKGERAEGFVTDGIDVTIGGDGWVQTAYLTMNGVAWLTNRKLQYDKNERRQVWLGANLGIADEAVQFTKQAFRKYLGMSLGIEPRDTPPGRVA